MVTGPWEQFGAMGFHNLIPLGTVWSYHVDNDMAIVWSPKMKSPEHEKTTANAVYVLFDVRKHMVPFQSLSHTALEHAMTCPSSNILENLMCSDVRDAVGP